MIDVSMMTMNWAAAISASAHLCRVGDGTCVAAPEGFDIMCSIGEGGM